MINPYQALMQAVLAERENNKVPTGAAAFKQGEVAENIGHDKLAKKPYNPYGVIKAEENTNDRPNNFHKEMLRDVDR